MPPEEFISRDELKAMMEVQAEATKQMVIIADKLNEIVNAQKIALENHSKIILELNNLKNNENNTEKSSIATKAVVEEMKDDIKHAKWFIAVITLVIIVSTVILRGIDNRILFTKQMEYERTHLHDFAPSEKSLPTNQIPNRNSE